jgi:cation diffusion facilitator family transporter
VQDESRGRQVAMLPVSYFWTNHNSLPKSAECDIDSRGVHAMEANLNDQVIGDREKTRVALTSVVAALFLTGLKIAVGVATGSLGIMAEALHSALDLAAAFMTLGAVRIAALPPDESHPYGHGKVESFSALFETLLLVVTSVWIISEAIERLFFRPVSVDPNIWSFVVMLISIGIDYGRSRALMRTARRYKSLALEADALHFSTDIYSSAVVILGLLMVRLGQASPHRDLLAKADSVAALGVALIVLWVSVRLGKETIDALMDRAPEGLAEGIIEEARRVPGVVSCDRVRVRPVGLVNFVDVVIGIPRSMPLEQAHAVACRVEERVRSLHPKADVIVHCEPVPPPRESWPERIQAIAGQQGLVVHEVRIRDSEGRSTVTLHLEVEPDLTLSESHAVAEGLEKAISAQLEGLEAVETHIEPRMSGPTRGDSESGNLAQVLDRLRDLAAEFPSLRDFHNVRVLTQGGQLYISLHCVFEGSLKIEEVHRQSSQIEHRLKSCIPGTETVHIHVEPRDVP